ncbi:hypothetical protein Raf01_48090 [Rugosimonospora africana]|uniref:Uncharacterized protein n=1 Tax=Rugosimonospora africana TaxID=556532 RepID=A0A8J3QV22_9ACTN|nr:hypothetical protein Raf01_48090 [Rugosimonospora africana]
MLALSVSYVSAISDPVNPSTGGYVASGPDCAAVAGHVVTADPPGYERPQAAGEAAP